MKILVVSHNVFSKTSNVGKTLAAYFRGIDCKDIAQFYIHSEIPTDEICENYYRITDKDAIKSVLTRKSGSIFGKSDIKTDAADSRTDTGGTAKLYQKGRSRSPFIYFARNTWWSMGKWNTKKLRAWLDEFSPDIVFFASGDYAFMYKIALKIARMRKIPLVVSCMDDYYFYNKNEDRFCGKLVHRRFMKQVKKTMSYASCFYPICEKMGKDYGELFGKPYHTLSTPSTFSGPLKREKDNSISYIGNLGYMRADQLVRLGRALKAVEAGGKPDFIDVYSGETDPERLSGLTEENGIRFHGSITADEVLEVMGRSMAVIHTESFNAQTRKTVAYSVSTKIADSLASGTPLIAYGPAEVASVEYLIENKAALCITENDDPSEALREFIQSPELRERIVESALALAQKNHDPEKNRRMLLDTMTEAVREFGNGQG
jgi:glycosyltransferase involved in cell wall biosynthesis